MAQKFIASATSSLTTLTTNSPDGFRPEVIAVLRQLRFGIYLDQPTEDRIPQPEIIARLTVNAPLALVEQCIGNGKQYRAISMDVGDQDGLRFDATKLHEVLDRYGIVNGFTIYPGTHTSAVADRFQNFVMPFFSKNLCFTAPCH